MSGLTKRFDAALCFTAELHRSQYRKGAHVPYLGHLLAVAALVIDDGGTEDEAIAALLHDSLEDQGDQYPGGRAALRNYIRNQFGTEVAAIVDDCTDDEGFAKDSAGTPVEQRERWLQRKREYITSIAHKTPQALRVTAADKTHNAESIIDSHAAIGPEVWLRFRTKSRQDQIDVYRGLASAIVSRNETLLPDKRTGLSERLLRAVQLMEGLT
jgi:(p)ppGpp synthase/HD superfamily hydrolase